jgi:hypothetical protein
MAERSKKSASSTSAPVAAPAAAPVEKKPKKSTPKTDFAPTPVVDAAPSSAAPSSVASDAVPKDKKPACTPELYNTKITDAANRVTLHMQDLNIMLNKKLYGNLKSKTIENLYNNLDGFESFIKKWLKPRKEKPRESSIDVSQVKKPAAPSKSVKPAAAPPKSKKSTAASSKSVESATGSPKRVESATGSPKRVEPATGSHKSVEPATGSHKSVEPAVAPKSEKPAVAPSNSVESATASNGVESVVVSIQDGGSPAASNGLESDADWDKKGKDSVAPNVEESVDYSHSLVGFTADLDEKGEKSADGPRCTEDKKFTPLVITENLMDENNSDGTIHFILQQRQTPAMDVAGENQDINTRVVNDNVLTVNDVQILKYDSLLNNLK